MQNRADRTYGSVYLHHIVHVRMTQTRINHLSSLALPWKGVELDGRRRSMENYKCFPSFAECMPCLLIDQH
jgi:hypothetical protein